LTTSHEHSQKRPDVCLLSFSGRSLRRESGFFTACWKGVEEAAIEPLLLPWNAFLIAMTEPFIFEPTSQVLGTKDAPDMLNWLATSLEVGAKLLLIDLVNVYALESSGIGILMIARNRARRAGARLVLCSLSEEVVLQIERAGLLEKFEILPNRDTFERVTRS
jgi:anti-anti-sigma factor